MSFFKYISLFTLVFAISTQSVSMESIKKSNNESCEDTKTMKELFSEFTQPKYIFDHRKYTPSHFNIAMQLLQSPPKGIFDNSFKQYIKNNNADAKKNFEATDQAVTNLPNNLLKRSLLSGLVFAPLCGFLTFMAILRIKEFSWGYIPCTRIDDYKLLSRICALIGLTSTIGLFNALRGAYCNWKKRNICLQPSADGQTTRLQAAWQQTKDAINALTYDTVE